MHEHSVLDGLMVEVGRHVAESGIKKVRVIKLILGPYSGFSAFHVREAFDHLQRHHAGDFPFLEDAVLAVETPEAHVLCPACGHQGAEDDLGQPCPACPAGKLELPETLTGLYLAGVEGA